MPTSAEQRANRAAYMRAYRKRKGESHRKWLRQWMRRYRNGPRREELLAQRREYMRNYRAKKKAELVELRSRVANRTTGGDE